MTAPISIDTRFDVRTDAGGKDPDSHSATLRRYHRLLWSKPLPDGQCFDLDAKLHHDSVALGEFSLNSDAIVHTYVNWIRPTRLVKVLREIPAVEKTAFYDLACTVGAYIVFPAQVRVEGRWRGSINQRRGIHPQIHDRFDLTLECIRLHYAGARSPLDEILKAYANFFSLFGDFRGYVDYFLLNDLVSEDGRQIHFFKIFEGFEGDALPASSSAEYRNYMRLSMRFIESRNQRIVDYMTALE